MIIQEFDWRSPYRVFQRFLDEPYAGMFYSTASSGGRWTHIVAGPELVFTVRNGRACVNDAMAHGSMSALRDMEKSRRIGPHTRAVPFTTGLVGYIGYEIGALMEPSAAGPPSPNLFPDMALAAYDASIGFDHVARRSYIVARSERSFERLRSALDRPEAGSRRRSGFVSPARSNFSKDDYCAAVAEVRNRIRNGALFQANISQRFQSQGAPPDYLELFTSVAALDPPYAALLQFPEGAIISGSPERFFSLGEVGEGRRIVCEPIKGTRRRAANAAEDAALAAELLADPKDRAENVMIADLIRNDLSRICVDGSISEEVICGLESFSTVHHLVSRISGRVGAEIAVADVLEALFPCGSITGAPKIEAMKTIADIERVGRGPYCGAIGYVDDRGNADFSVAIRILIVENLSNSRRITVPAGGGVTLRSDPESEYEETLLKARALVAAYSDQCEAVA
jgi:para-aminobenzoate synthetase component 1